MRDHAGADARYRQILGLGNRNIGIPEPVANVLAVWGELDPGAAVLFGGNKLLFVEGELIEVCAWDGAGAGITLEVASVRVIKSIAMTPDPAGAEDRTRWEREPNDTNRPFPGCAFRLIFKRPVGNQTDLEFGFTRYQQGPQLETMLELYRNTAQNRD